MRLSAPLLTLIVLCQLGTAAAQPRVGAYFEPIPDEVCGIVEAGVPFDIYLIVENTPDGVAFYQFGLQLDPRLTIVGTPEIFPAGAVDMGDDALVDGLNFVVDTSASCLEGAEPKLLVHLRAVAPVTDDELQLCILAGVSEELSVAGYLDCDSGDLHLLGAHLPRPGCDPGASCSAVSVVKVATASPSWSSLKASYRDRLD